MLDAPPPPRTPESSLHFVEEQARAPLIAKLPNRREVARLRDGHAQGRGDRFEDHRGGLLVDRRIHRRDAVERHLNEARKIRAKRITKLGIPGRQGKAGVTVVATLDRNDLGATRRASRCLDRNVDRLATGHAKHDPGKRVA